MISSNRSVTDELSRVGLFDSHAHYYDARFATEAEGGADAILRREVFGAGVETVINVATSPENALRCIEQAGRYEGMYAAVGIHPGDCKSLEGSVEEEVGRIRFLLDTEEKRQKNKIVAIGEIGLDYYWQEPEKEIQQYWFREQLRLAHEVNLPVIIHSREAAADTYKQRNNTCLRGRRCRY